MEKKIALGFTTAALLAAASASADVQITDVQSGLLGLTVPYNGSTIPDDTGATAFQGGLGVGAEALTDGNTGTFSTNFTGGASGDLGWVGIRFNTAQSNVSRFEFNAKVFSDGGWFVSSNDPEGNTLAPVIQVTTADLSTLPTNVGGSGNFVSNSDNIWTTVSAASDYPNVDGSNGNTAPGLAGLTDNQVIGFDLLELQNSITGIRVLGSQGGTVANPGGFIGASEVRAYTASSNALAAGTAIGLDFGPVLSDNATTIMNNIWPGNGETFSAGTLRDTSGDLVDGVAVTALGTGFSFTNDDSATNSEVPGQPTIFNDSNLTDWFGTNGTGEIRFTGLDDSLTYDVLIGHAFNENDLVSDGVYSADGVLNTGITATNVHDSTTGGTFVTLQGLQSSGGALTINVSATEAGSILAAVSSMTITAVPEPSSLALLGLGGLLIARRRRY